MDMVGHPAVGENRDAVISRCRVQKAAVKVAVVVVEKNGIAANPSLRYVMGNVGQNYPCSSCHGVTKTSL